MRGKMVLWLLGLTIVAIAAVIAAWQWDLLPRQVIATGTITTSDGKTLRTRKYYRTSRDTAYKAPSPGPQRKTAVWEVELPSGRWIDCGADCAEAARKALR